MLNDLRQLRRLDLNLLVVFDAVFRERHVTRAADRLGMSQPAVSNALQRLRDSLQDDLLIRTPSGMEATDRANQLAGPIHSIINELEALLADRTFDPLTARETVTLATVDYFNVSLLPKLLRVVTAKAPNLTLRIIPTNGRAIDLLDQRQADLALASFGDVPERFEKLTLHHEGYVCVLRKNHPVLEQGLDMARYAGLKHILHSPNGDLRGATDAALAKQGLQRHIALTVSSFRHAEEILEQSDMVLTAPKSVSEKLIQRPGLTVAPCPVEVSAAAQRLDMMWHASFGARPVNGWLRRQIQGLFADLPR